MGTDLRAIMRRDRRRQVMIHDPDLTRDALLFALTLDEVLAMQREAGHRGVGPDNDWVGQIGELARGPLEQDERRRFWVKHVIADDVPRYEAALNDGHPACVAPMIRREGPCGKPGTTRLIDYDPATGERAWIGLCSRHRHLEESYQRRRQEWIANGTPTPPPNVGGVLMRYFKTDWDTVYRWADPYTRRSARKPEAVPPRPQLRLIHGTSS